ncbi:MULTISPECIES: hemin ABC transporter substrate-binding protein [Chryseobacterium]|jgi:iron complex transport system substrate-binding protein|uniref:Iron complex transport system substrate-binding protein n=1 Tax=Chryseobacterium geocarposphaerae TaxID=1416776 RepID=A0ABU1L9Q3_9FLAO|nr:MULTISPECIES: ABC transporter substrate-binding protein [Chryseobacterium]ALR29866.1 ABC transporter substrate-binding protein [Chryseobacterium sp. IHB B 17019]MDR6403444.1 iron complex transport system substrate-binding protein [Chryseobacterium geocarposphaerae]MDR6696998.1 iron complex transport system substrate-binding protein [Chryseobacterium ginsenosidimutans]
MKKFILAASVLVAVYSCKKETGVKSENNTETSSETPKSNNKIVTLNGGITEIVAALGHEKEIVGTDVTSTYPESLKATAKDLGHVRSMTIEPIMAVNPTLILASDKDINPELLGKIKSSGIQAEIFKQEFTVDGTKKLIADVAKAIGNTDYQKLNDKIDADLKQIQPIAKKPKVLFIYARGNMLMVSGTKTPMDALIGLAGGENAVKDFEDFKPLTPEAVVKANPDVLFFFTSGLQGAGGNEGALKMPGVAQTNAGKNKKIIAMDGGLVSGFGPRLGEAAVGLNKLLVESTK